MRISRNSKISAPLLLLLLLNLTACTEQMQVDLFGSTANASNSYQRVGMDSGVLTAQQFLQLNYLAAGQSPRAMNSWRKGRYPAYVSGNTELWRVDDQPGTCARISYDASGVYQGDYQFEQCPE